MEGAFAGYSVDVSPLTAPHVEFSIDAGYGIHNREARWDVGVALDRVRWSASASVFDRTVSPNDWIVRTAENTVFAFLFKGDYLDYYRARNGFEVDVRLKPRRTVSLIANLTAFQYRSMEVDIGWSVFRNSRPFRPNPAIREGDAAVAKTGVVYDNRRKSPVFRNAWFASLLYERGFREFPYDGVSLTFKRFQKTIFGRQAFVARGLVGSRESTAEQHLFDIGGIGTLRGYRIKEYSGNRVLLFNVDYLFRGDAVGKISRKLGQIVELILFADAGWTNLETDDADLFEGFGAFRLDDVKTGAGAAIALYRQLIRFNVARRFDDDIDDWTFSVRFRRTF